MLLLIGCLLISDSEHTAREHAIADRDGDGLWALAYGGTDCDDGDPAVGEAEPYYVDGDADGFGDQAGTAVCALPENGSWTDGDCDDANADVHPDASELCDAVDNDCDGVTDPDSAVDAPTWFADADGDGFGDPDRTVAACSQPADYLDDTRDCNDLDPDVHPDAREVCDGEDTDCNGTVDDPPWWPDADGDGFGDAEGKAQVACDAPLGHTDDALDCDDQDPGIHPDASEWCADGVDNDCNGEVDEDDAADAATWYADADQDGWGDAAATTRACEQPSGYQAAHGDCDDTDPTVNPDAAETWYDGLDANCDGWDDFDADQDGFATDAEGGEDCDDADALIHPDAREACGDAIDNNCNAADDLGECALSGDLSVTDGRAAIYGTVSNDYVGYTVAGPGDLDGDGLADVLVSGAGGGFTFLGPVSGTYDAREGAQYCIDPWCDYSTGAMSDVAGAGDATGDGLADILLPGAYASYLVAGPATAGSLAVDEEALAILTIDTDAGVFTGVGDLNNDGVDDVAVGRDYHGDSYEGGVWVALGPLSGAYDLGTGDADVAITSDVANRGLGESVAAAGDTDGDGFDDLVAGSPDADSYTGVTDGYIVLLRGASELPSELSDEDCDAVIWGDASEDGYTSLYAAHKLAPAGDIDADGYADVMVGSRGRGAWVLTGPLTDGNTISGSASVRLVPQSSWYYGGQPGYEVAGAGDIDGDGQSDMLVGDYVAGRSIGDAQRGYGFLFLGPASGSHNFEDADAIIEGESEEGYNAHSMAGLGDMSGDGFDDIVLGAYFHDALGGGSRAGGAYVMVGGAD